MDKFDEVMMRYFNKFGTNYPLIVTSTRPLSEHIKIMEEAIRTNKIVENPKLGKEVY